MIRVKAIYYRNDPILLNMAPQWPGAPHHSVRFEGGILWEQLEAVGVPGIVGTYVHNPFLVVVAIKQQYAGHAKQAGMAVLGCAASRAQRPLRGDRRRGHRSVQHEGGDLGDDDARRSRDRHRDRRGLLGDAARSAHAAGADRQRARTPIRARSIYAVRPWAWKDKFPPVNRIDKDQREAILKKYGDTFAFPQG